MCKNLLIVAIAIALVSLGAPLGNEQVISPLCLEDCWFETSPFSTRDMAQN